VFRFADSDLKGLSKTLKPHEECLTRVLRDTMPGLVQSATGDTLLSNAMASPITPSSTVPIATMSSSTTIASYTIPNSMINPTGTSNTVPGMDQHHKLLIKPDTFNITVLFQPTLTFLDRVVDVLPMGLESAKASSTVMEEFVLKVYLPQLEEKVLDLFHLTVSSAWLRFFILWLLDVIGEGNQVRRRSCLIRYRLICLMSL